MTFSSDLLKHEFKRLITLLTGNRSFSLCMIDNLYFLMIRLQNKEKVNVNVVKD